MSNIKILIADSQLLYREGLKTLLSQEKDFEVVGEVVHSIEIENAVQKYNPDVVIIDYNLEDKFSADDIQMLSQQLNIGVLIITSDMNKDNINKVLNYGAKSFIRKECSKEEVIDAVYSTYNQEKYICNKVLYKLLSNTEQASQFSNCDPSILSTREHEILMLVGEGCTTSDIAEKLHLSQHTVSTHRKNIIKKLGFKNKSELVAYAASLTVQDRELL